MVEPAQPPPPESATLLRRLAEAADGFRDGQRRVVIASRDFPHDVIGVFLESDADGIEAAKAAGGPGYERYGPYQTPAESQQPSQRKVVSATVTYNTGETETFAATQVDALVWSVAAFDKFYAPYLVSTAGAAHAQAERVAFVSGATLLRKHDLHSL